VNLHNAANPRLCMDTLDLLIFMETELCIQLNQFNIVSNVLIQYLSLVKLFVDRYFEIKIDGQWKPPLAF